MFDAATYGLGEVTDFGPLTVLGAVFTVLLAGFWIVVTQRSFVGMWTGALFRAPCLSEETGMVRDCSEDVHGTTMVKTML
ncbi:hypothetical protein BAE27_10965 [Acidithiobacillus caldus]|uniref:Uncharacterized protein n=1 Tax=Acidithiobacillus caldus TaxID=33059 RepID=A0A1E7YL21_9PROT|nr:hypothetical protein BAE27_10965 [Acidithiobacillus caldus]